MCLALVAWQSHPDYPLVVVTNRDEFYARRTRPAAWWGQTVSLLGGRDEEAGGTWVHCGHKTLARFTGLIVSEVFNECIALISSFRATS